MPSTKLRAVTIDCPEPKVLADFYSGLTGYEVGSSGDDFAGLTGEGGLWIGFQRVDDYTPPVWPGQQVPQQFHLDLGVEDLDAAQEEAVGLGASVPEHQPGGGRWRVLLDPAGHPFCLVTF